MSVSGKPIPAVLSQLLSRTLLATFRLNPRPASLSDSVAIHQQINSLISPLGKIIHYRQSLCPVTKERLEKLHVLVEDFESNPDRVDIVAKSESLVADLTKLESKLINEFSSSSSNSSEERIQLEHASRDPRRILALKYLR